MKLKELLNIVSPNEEIWVYIQYTYNNDKIFNGLAEDFITLLNYENYEVVQITPFENSLDIEIKKNKELNKELNQFELDYDKIEEKRDDIIKEQNKRENKRK